MKEEIKKIWVEALESDEYQQGRQKLKTAIGFCCLGVLCELFRKVTGQGWWESHPHDEDYIEFKDGSYSSSAVLTKEVQEWAGLKSDNPTVFKAENSRSLAGLNDEGRSFKEIALIIKENL